MKALLGHSLKGDVISGHYVVMDVDRLREPAQRLEDTILRLAGVIEGNVLPFPRQA